MKDLYFVNSWPKLEAAWSGTPMSLYTALSKKLHTHCIDSYIQRNKILSALNALTMSLLNFPAIEQKISSTPISAGAPLFVFGEYSSAHVKDTYCYQDLSVDYLLRLRQENDPAAVYAAKKVIPTGIFKKKQEKANQFYQNCAGVFTMSQWLREDLINSTGLPPHKVHHVGGGSNIDVSKIDYSKKQGNKYLFVGKDWNRKNGELVVSAFKQLSAANPEYNPQLYIAGPEKEPASIVGQENIFYLGRLSYEELIAYYNLCDYYVMPSNFEAYGLVFAEALCFGLPCIGKNICAMPEFIQDGRNGYLIQNNDPAELAEAMEKLLIGGKDMARAVQADKDYYLSKYSWDSVAERIVQVMENDGYFN